MNTLPKKTFQTKLRELRIASGRTQEEVASELFFTRTALSNYESGKRYPSLDVLLRLAAYYNVEIDYLLRSDESPRFVDEATRRKVINFKYLIKNRYLDLVALSDVDKLELIDYYNYLKSREK